MTKEIWLNLPVKNIAKAKDFFTKIGFTPQENQPCDEMAGFKIGEKQMSVMLVENETFKGFSRNKLADTKTVSEVLISFDAESREEIDETARKVFDAGGTILVNRRKFKAGCMVSLSRIWTGIAGISFLWISAKCRRLKSLFNKTKERKNNGKICRWIFDPDCKR